MADTLKQIRELQRMLGKKTMEAEILKRSGGDRPLAKMACALTLVAGERPVKAVSKSLGVARSQLTTRIKQTSEGKKARRQRALDDTALADQIRAAIADLPSYGYRRV